MADCIVTATVTERDVLSVELLERTTLAATVTDRTSLAVSVTDRTSVSASVTDRTTIAASVTDRTSIAASVTERTVLAATVSLAPEYVYVQPEGDMPSDFRKLAGLQYASEKQSGASDETRIDFEAVSIHPGDMRDGSFLEFDVSGAFTNTTGSDDDVEWYVEFDGTTLYTFQMAAPASSTGTGSGRFWLNVKLIATTASTQNVVLSGHVCPRVGAPPSHDSTTVFSDVSAGIKNFGDGLVHTLNLSYQKQADTPTVWNPKAYIVTHTGPRE